MHDTMKRFLILSAAALLAVSCFRGPVVSRNLDLRDFTAVRVADGADVTFTQADSFSVVLRTRKGVIDTVDCKVIDGELYIGTKGHQPLGARKFSLEVSAPVLSRVHVMEASSFSGGCSSDENLTVSAEKTGKVSLDGVRCKNLYILFPAFGIKNGGDYIVPFTIPFNLIKGVALTVITGLIYKPLSPLLHEKIR